jgi:NAD(P)-dependent dehydrogenase (short-subunit alcohol dehydrogenase family)
VKRVCLFTGASGTLGTSFIQRYSEQYDIVAVYRSRPPRWPSQQRRLIDPLDPAAALPDNDDAVFSVQADLFDDTECRRVAELALARFGRVDMLVNAAAVFAREPMVGSARLAENFDRQFRLNVRVPLILSVTLADLFWRGRASENLAMNRHVINVASIGGVQVFAGNGLGVYSASKAALVQMSYHMASEFCAFGVRVNAVAPSAFPRIVPADRVSSSLRELDEGRANGRLVILDKDTERMP